MHEFSLCESIIKQVVKVNQGQVDNLDKVTVTVGKLAGVDIESLCFWFPVVAAKFNCPNLRLEVIKTDGVAHCNSCNHDFNLINLYDSCPNCGRFADFTIISGRELALKSFSHYSN